MRGGGAELANAPEQEESPDAERFFCPNLGEPQKLTLLGETQRENGDHSPYFAF